MPFLPVHAGRFPVHALRSVTSRTWSGPWKAAPIAVFHAWSPTAPARSPTVTARYVPSRSADSDASRSSRISSVRKVLTLETRLVVLSRVSPGPASATGMRPGHSIFGTSKILGWRTRLACASADSLRPRRDVETSARLHWRSSGFQACRRRGTDSPHTSPRALQNMPWTAQYTTVNQVVRFWREMGGGPTGRSHSGPGAQQPRLPGSHRWKCPRDGAKTANPRRTGPCASRAEGSTR